MFNDEDNYYNEDIYEDYEYENFSVYDEDEKQESDYGDTEEDYYDNQELNMVAGAKAIERVGLPGLEVLGLGKTDNFNKNPLEYFQTKVDAISRNLSVKYKINISQDDINIMLRKSDLLMKVEHKNPTAYILGFLATSGGRNIDQKTVINVIKNILPFVEKNFVTAPDIIRYSKLWLEINLK